MATIYPADEFTGIPVPAPERDDLDVRTDEMLRREIEAMQEDVPGIGVQIVDDAEIPEIRANLRRVLAKRDRAEAAIAAGTARRIRIKVGFETTVVTALSLNDATSLIQDVVLDGACSGMSDLTTVDGSAGPLQDMVERWEDYGDVDDFSCPSAKALLEAKVPALLLELDETGMGGGESSSFIVGSTDEQLEELRGVSGELAAQRAALTTRRDQLIRDLAAAGIGSTTVGRAAGISTTSVFKIVSKAKS